MYPSTTQRVGCMVVYYPRCLSSLLKKRKRRLSTPQMDNSNSRPSDVATQHLAGDKSATLGAVESTPSSSNITLAAQNEDIYTGHGDGGRGLEAGLEQLLKASFFYTANSFVNQTYWNTLDDLWTLVKTNSITLPVPTKPRTKQGKNSLMSPMLCR